MTYHGIDYGLGRSNIDRETGIRFGVIPLHALHEWAHESFEDDYGPPHCPKCGNEAVDPDQAPDDDHEEGFEPYRKRGCCGDYYCLGCKIYFDGEDAFGDEPVASTLDDGEHQAELHSDGDIFILRSPYYTRAQFCSPCAPGACYLTSFIEPETVQVRFPKSKKKRIRRKWAKRAENYRTFVSGPRAYCLGHEFFEGDRAPYPVYRVSDGSLVAPPKEGK